MKSRKLKLVGWQSWTHCTEKSKLIKRIRYYSPFGDNNKDIKISKNSSKQRPITGWCSWNAFMLSVNENAVIDIAKWIKNQKQKIPLEYILVDDGWADWGDWAKPNYLKFPNGILSTSRKIDLLGFKPGLWIAPYLVDPKSEVFKNHPEWLARDKNGKIIDGKKNYFFDPLIPSKKYLLDLENKNAYSYILNCFKTIIKVWKIKLLKVDFLYAGHFNPKYKSSKAPDFLLKKLLTDIKNIDKDVVLIACGCPLYPAAGIVDAMRISDDVILPPLKNIWYINHLLHTIRLNQLKDNFELRKTTKDLWVIDPDMFVCHPSFGLTDKQILEFQKIVINSNGVIFLGDYLPDLNKSQLNKYIYPLFKTKLSKKNK